MLPRSTWLLSYLVVLMVKSGRFLKNNPWKSHMDKTLETVQIYSQQSLFFLLRKMKIFLVISKYIDVKLTHYFSCKITQFTGLCQFSLKLPTLYFDAHLCTYPKVPMELWEILQIWMWVNEVDKIQLVQLQLSIPEVIQQSEQNW